MMPHLLLRADGVLVANWCPLDPEPPYQPPDRWDGPHVAHRFAEAIDTLCKLPLGRWGPSEIRNCWPAYYDEWADLLAQLGDGADGIEQTWQRRNRVRIPPSAVEISQMERALFWPGAYLRGRHELTCALNVCGLAHARGLSVRDVVKRGKHARIHSPTQWNKLALTAADTIAVGLRVDGIAVF
jgi:hypothetical protein